MRREAVQVQDGEECVGFSGRSRVATRRGPTRAEAQQGAVSRHDGYPKTSGAKSGKAAEEERPIALPHGIAEQVAVPQGFGMPSEMPLLSGEWGGNLKHDKASCFGDA